jgi:hypothetical protein
MYNYQIITYLIVRIRKLKNLRNVSLIVTQFATNVQQKDLTHMFRL